MPMLLRKALLPLIVFLFAKAFPAKIVREGNKIAVGGNRHIIFPHGKK